MCHKNDSFHFTEMVSKQYFQITETRNISSGKGSQLYGSSENSECQFKTKFCFLAKTDKVNTVK